MSLSKVPLRAVQERQVSFEVRATGYHKFAQNGSYKPDALIPQKAILLWEWWVEHGENSQCQKDDDNCEVSKTEKEERNGEESETEQWNWIKASSDIKITKNKNDLINYIFSNI